jgi:hypothetical protein
MRGCWSRTTKKRYGWSGCCDVCVRLLGTNAMLYRLLFFPKTCLYSCSKVCSFYIQNLSSFRCQSNLQMKNYSHDLGAARSRKFDSSASLCSHECPASKCRTVCLYCSLHRTSISDDTCPHNTAHALIPSMIISFFS